MGMFTIPTHQKTLIKQDCKYKGSNLSQASLLQSLRTNGLPKNYSWGSLMNPNINDLRSILVHS